MSDDQLRGPPPMIRFVISASLRVSSSILLFPNVESHSGLILSFRSFLESVFEFFFDCINSFIF